MFCSNPTAPLLGVQKLHTRSSPIGPAEQEDGGSLCFCRQYDLCLEHARLLRLEAEYRDGRGAGLNKSTYRPRSVSSLLILLRAMLLVVYDVCCVNCKLMEGGNERENEGCCC